MMHNDMEALNRSFTNAQPLPIKVVQFGDGNFLRGFADYVIDTLNEKGFNGGVAVVKNRPGGSMAQLQNQEGLFTLFTEGIKNGLPVREKKLITCISRVVNPYEDYAAFLSLAAEDITTIISNTTEAGIYFDEAEASLNTRPHQSFAAKLTALLHARYEYVNGTAKGIAILPCELVENNGRLLQQAVLQYCGSWQLGEGFTKWLAANVTFYNTLVDRIVSGYPKENTAEYTLPLGYEDALITVCEPYLFWAIEGDEHLQNHFAYHLAHNVLSVGNLQPYRIRKVRILNGAHTLLAQIGRLAGVVTVGQGMSHSFCERFIKDAIYQEILPTVPLPIADCEAYTTEVLDRFGNPYLNHYLTDIALNSVSKYKVRLLPVMEDFYQKQGKLPLHLVFALAGLIRLYKGTWEGRAVVRADQPEVLEAFDRAWASKDYESVVALILPILGSALLPEKELQNLVAKALECIDQYGVEEGFYKLRFGRFSNGPKQ